MIITGEVRSFCFELFIFLNLKQPVFLTFFTKPNQTLVCWSTGVRGGVKIPASNEGNSVWDHGQGAAYRSSGSAGTRIVQQWPSGDTHCQPAADRF